MSYSMRQGDKRGPEVDLHDFTYDGEVHGGILSGGLGQLTDWEEGNYNFRLDQRGQGKKGYEWVGWKNDTSNVTSSLPVEINFRFGHVRNFTAIRIHANNFFSKEVSVFRGVVVQFSVGGLYLSDEVLYFEYMKDTLIEIARHIVIPVPHRLGRLVRLTFVFEAKWIMISEIRFDSGESLGVVSCEVIS